MLELEKKYGNSNKKLYARQEIKQEKVVKVNDDFKMSDKFSGPKDKYNDTKFV